MLPDDALDRREESTEGLVPRARRLVASRTWRAALLIALPAFVGLDRIPAGRGVAMGQEAAAGRPRADRILLDPAAVWSRLVVHRVGEGRDARTVVVLGRPAGSPGVPDTSQPIRLDMLPREMVRQAVLIAARDELGLSTRDEVIDETPAVEKGGDGATVEVVSYIRDNRSREFVRRIDDQKLEVIFSHETPTARGRNLELIKLLTSAEALSREAFPGVLKGLGLEGKANAIKPDGELPAQVEDRLASVGFLEVLLAVRDLHRSIRTDGESPARLGALARGYALLGVLSEHEWHPAHRAYKARALLYAQRMVARDPEGPWGLWHRAFVLAMVGRHRDALDDLKAAGEKAGLKGAPAAPDWLELVDAYCRFDSARLTRPPGRHAKLAALLRMFTLAYPRSLAAGLNAARDVVLLQPYCFRAHDAMSSFQGVATQHVTNMIGPQGLVHFTTVKLPTVVELPASVKGRLDGKPGIIPLAELLDKAGAPESDPGEPSWAVLGHMLRETRFVQIHRILYFMRVMLVVPADAFWNEVHLDVANHRYRPYLESLALPPRDSGPIFQQFGERVDLTEIEWTESAMSRALWNLPGQRAKSAWGIATTHEDETAEMAMSLSEARPEEKVAIARNLLTVSPYHPYARAVLIQKDWDTVKDQVAAWQRESGDSPAFLAGLGEHYSTTKEYDAAQRALARYIELSPDAWAYQMLAANFKAQGNIERWQATLDEFLDKVEDLGLDHARVRVQVAEYYMGLKQWDKARSYAEAAAQTWAGWAMDCAARCAEAEKDWERAEAWYSNIARRYPGESWAVWYFFCKRTGQGRLDAARAAVDQYVAENANRPDLLNEEYVGCFYWLDGRPEKAKAAFARSFERQKWVSAAISLAMIADDEKDAARRDELLNELVTKYKDKAPKSLSLCQLLLDSIFAPAGKNQPLDIEAVDRGIDAIPEEGRANAAFFVGWFLKNHGESRDATRYLRRCADSPHGLVWYRYLAIDALKRMDKK